MGAAASLFVDVRANVSGAVAGLKATDAQLKTTAASAKRMDAAMATTAATSARAGAATAAAGVQAGAAAGAYRDASGRMREANGRFLSTGASATGAAAGAKKASFAFGGLGKAGQSTRGAMQGFGVGAMAAQGGALALAYGAGKAVKSAVDFDSAMRNVNSIAQLSEGKFRSLGESVKGMAGDTAQSPQKLAAGLYDLVSSGFNASDSLKVLRASATAATAGLTTTEVSTAAVAAVLNAYQMPASKAASVSDTLFQTVNKGVISFDQLAQNIGDVLPFSSSLGVSLNQVGASISTMTKGGINPAETMTRLKAIMAALIAPSDALKSKMRDLGFTSAVSMLKAKGFQGSIDMLARSTGGSKEKLAQLFPNIRALGGVMALTGGKAKAAQADLASFKNTVGATNTALSQQKQSTQYKFNKAKADAEALAITVAGSLTPALSSAATSASDITSALSGIGRAIDSVAGKGASKKGMDWLFAPITALPKDIARKISGMASQAWHGKKMEVPVAAKIAPGSLKDVGAAIKASGKAGKLTIPVKADGATKASSQMSAVSKAVQKINAQKAKTDVTTPGADAARSRMAQLYSDIARIPTSKTVNITVRTNKVKGHAAGGYAGGLAEVNERGPESARLPGGHIAMLGDGKRQVMALPNGSYVYTAAQTRRMFGDIPAYKGGGPHRPKRKKGEKEKDFNRRVKDWEGRYNSWANRQSSIKDSRSDAASASIPLITGPDGKLAVDTLAADKKAIVRAKRHLAEARRLKGPERKEAIARAKAEVAQATQQYAIDASSSTDNGQQVLADALKAQADALAENTKQLKDNKDFAERVHTATKGVTDTTMAGILNGTLGGQLTDWVLTNSPRMASP